MFFKNLLTYDNTVLINHSQVTKHYKHRKCTMSLLSLFVQIGIMSPIYMTLLLSIH
jgi:hypothetical protein